MSDKKTCGCPIEMPYGCPIHNPLPSAASPSYTVLIAEISALRAEVARLEKERDELLMRVEDLHRLSQGLNQSALKLMDGGEGWKARAEKAEAMLSKNEGRVKEIVDESLLARAERAEAECAALEKVAEAARILEHYDSSPSDCDRVEEALRLAIAELAQLGTKEKL